MFTPGPASAKPLDRATFYHAVLLDGRLVGHWRHSLEKGRVVIETQIRRPLKSAESRALDAAVERYGDFLGLPATLRSAR
jgi:hypothetical protein